MVRSLEALWHQVRKAIAQGFDGSSKDILSSTYMFSNKVRQQLYSSNLSQYFLYQTTARDLSQLQRSRNPLLYLSGRQDTTHVYLFNF